jgi:hypothetical protein
VLNVGLLKIISVLASVDCKPGVGGLFRLRSNSIAYRINGVVVNMPEYLHAFNCPAGSPMAPVKRCKVW